MCIIYRNSNGKFVITTGNVSIEVCLCISDKIDNQIINACLFEFRSAYKINRIETDSGYYYIYLSVNKYQYADLNSPIFQGFVLIDTTSNSIYNIPFYIVSEKVIKL